MRLTGPIHRNFNAFHTQTLMSSTPPGTTRHGITNSIELNIILLTDAVGSSPPRGGAARGSLRRCRFAASAEVYSSHVLAAAGIGQDTVRIALQSIWLGVIVSVGLMLVAAFGFLPALLGAWLQEIVDLIAILGALRAIGTRSERVAPRLPQHTVKPTPPTETGPVKAAEH